MNDVKHNFPNIYFKGIRLDEFVETKLSVSVEVNCVEVKVEFLLFFLQIEVDCQEKRNALSKH